MVTRAYWWKGRPNFGDALTPLILKHFCDLDAQHAPVAEADVICVGSILGHIPQGWTGSVIGAGAMYGNMPVRLKDATVYALRGPLSARGVRGDFALGDPGILASHLIPSQSKHYRLGIVPHLSDWANEDAPIWNHPEFTQYDPICINVMHDPLTVLRLIASCDKIITSSLHGAIVADSFGIPRRIEYAPRFDKEGGVFKFRDYHQSLGMRFELGKTMTANRFAVERVQEGLIDALRAYATIAKTHGESTH